MLEIFDLFLISLNDIEFTKSTGCTNFKKFTLFEDKFCLLAILIVLGGLLMTLTTGCTNLAKGSEYFKLFYCLFLNSFN